MQNKAGGIGPQLFVVINVIDAVPSLIYDIGRFPAGCLARNGSSPTNQARQISGTGAGTHRVDVRVPDILQVVGDVEVALHVGAGLLRRPPTRARGNSLPSAQGHTAICHAPTVHWRAAKLGEYAELHKPERATTIYQSTAYHHKPSDVSLLQPIWLCDGCFV